MPTVNNNNDNNGGGHRGTQRRRAGPALKRSRSSSPTPTVDDVPSFLLPRSPTAPVTGAFGADGVPPGLTDPAPRGTVSYDQFGRVATVRLVMPSSIAQGVPPHIAAALAMTVLTNQLNAGGGNGHVGPPLGDEFFDMLLRVMQRLGEPVRRGVATDELAAHTTLRCGRGGNDGGACAVCQEDVRVRQRVRQLRCEHRFHVRCIDGWLAEHGDCPLCRSKVVDAPTA
jgi:hypothetical protein